MESQRQAPSNERQSSRRHSHLTFERDPGRALMDLESFLYPPGNPAFEDEQVRHPGVGQGGLGLASAIARLADEDHGRVHTCANVVSVLRKRIEGDIIGADDMPCFEFARAADVQEPSLWMAISEVPEFLRTQDPGLIYRKCHLVSALESATDSLIYCTVE
jgi:hypothetical protein